MLLAETLEMRMFSESVTGCAKIRSQKFLKSYELFTYTDVCFITVYFRKEHQGNVRIM